VGAALLAAVVAGTLYAGARAGAEQPPSYRTVTPGETLWSIAAEHYPHSEDPRVKIEAIREANGLEGYTIHPGEHLELPSAST
jgi:LysM repeat protein